MTWHGAVDHRHHPQLSCGSVEFMPSAGNVSYFRLWNLLLRFWEESKVLLSMNAALGWHRRNRQLLWKFWNTITFFAIIKENRPKQMSPRSFINRERRGTCVPQEERVQVLPICSRCNLFSSLNWLELWTRAVAPINLIEELVRCWTRVRAFGVLMF